MSVLVSQTPRELMIERIRLFQERIESELANLCPISADLIEYRDQMLNWVKSEGRKVVESLVLRVEKEAVSQDQLDRLLAWMKISMDLAGSFMGLPYTSNACIEMMIDWYADRVYRMKKELESIFGWQGVV